MGLEPRLGPSWRSWVTEKGGIEPELATEIERRILALTARIAEAFGRQFEIGHSYVTPTARLEPGTTRAWFRQVAETEIGPLLRTTDLADADVERNPDDIADLVAALLARAVEQRQRRQLSLGYRSRSADLSRVRGRIDVLRTERRQ